MITVTDDGQTWHFPTWAMLRTLCLFREYFETWPWKERHVVDVGACVGSFSIAAQLLSCQVTSLEPWPAALDVLRANVPNEVLAAAASNQKGQATMVAGAKWGMSHLSRAGTDPVPVEMVRLDDVVRRPVSLIKLDVEGHELQALQGARDILVRDRPRIIVELGGPAQRGGQPAAAQAFLKNMGYVARAGLSKVDWLFTHATDQVVVER